jgi:hypothetical protein
MIPIFKPRFMRVGEGGPLECIFESLIVSTMTAGLVMNIETRE